MDLRESNNDLILLYKGKEVFVVLSKDEITNNTFNGLFNTGLLEERIVEAIAEIGVLKDLHKPK